MDCQWELQVESRPWRVWLGLPRHSRCLDGRGRDSTEQRYLQRQAHGSSPSTANYGSRRARDCPGTCRSGSDDRDSGLGDRAKSFRVATLHRFGLEVLGVFKIFSSVNTSCQRFRLGCSSGSTLTCDSPAPAGSIHRTQMQGRIAAGTCDWASVGEPARPRALTFRRLRRPSHLLYGYVAGFEFECMDPGMPWNPLLVHNFKLKFYVKHRYLFLLFEHTILSLSRSENRATTVLHDNSKAANHLTSSLIRTNHRMILKNPQNGTTRAASRPGRLRRRRSPHARDRAHAPHRDRWEFFLRCASKPRRRLMSRTRLGRRPPQAAR